MFFRDESRPFFIIDPQSAKFPRGRYEDAAASSTEPCGGTELVR